MVAAVALRNENPVKHESLTPVTELRHVRSAEEKRAAEEIANRQKCEDFDRFKPLFEKIQQEIESGVRETRPFELKAEIRPGSWFIVGGQKAYVAEMGDVFTNAQGRTDARLRVIFDNGTQSNMLMRSLQRALHKDEAGRREPRGQVPKAASRRAEGAGLDGQGAESGWRSAKRRISSAAAWPTSRQ